MANLCDNSLYAHSCDPQNLKYINDYFRNNFKDACIEEDDEFTEIYFSSRWTFPLEEMDKMVKDLPNKDDIYIRCLSVEYGCLYHELMVYEGEEWNSV